MKFESRKAHSPVVSSTLLGLVLLGVSACTPSDNWRRMNWTHAGLSYQLPCKEDQHSKALPLLDEAKMLVVEMHGCEYEDMVFAVAYAELAHPEQAAPTLLRWQKAYPATQALQIKTMLQGKKIVLATVLDIANTANEEAVTKAEASNSRDETRRYFFDHIQWNTK